MVAVTGTEDGPLAPASEPEEAPLAPGTVMIPDFHGMGVGRALDEARKVHVEVEVSGTGHVIVQEPPPGPAAGATRVKLRFSDDARRISAR